MTPRSRASKTMRRFLVSLRDTLGTDRSSAPERSDATNTDPEHSAPEHGDPANADSTSEDGSVYGPSYFGAGRDSSGDRQGISGYAVYDRVSSNADIAAYLLWRNFRAEKALDVGCAKGYLVEALRELGVDAYGCDVSEFAVENASSAVSGLVRTGDLETGLPYSDAEFDLISALEVLEHLHPEKVSAALAELRRVSRGVVYATIPSFGYNASGPDGHFEGKVRPECLERYRVDGDDRGGPIPFEELAVDSSGQPVEGHLTIASFQWWTEAFARAGFVRDVEVERRLYRDISPLGLAKFWNLYVFCVPGASSRSLLEPREPMKSLWDLGLVHPLVQDAASKGLLAVNPESASKDSNVPEASNASE